MFDPPGQSFKVKTIDGDGHCLYSGVGEGLALLGFTKPAVPQLRGRTGEWLEQHWNGVEVIDFGGGIECNATVRQQVCLHEEGVGNEIGDISGEEYVKRFVEEGYGGLVVQAVLAKILGIKICVYLAKRNKATNALTRTEGGEVCLIRLATFGGRIEEEEERRTEVHLLYDTAQHPSGHYDLLIPVNGFFGLFSCLSILA